MGKDRSNIIDGEDYSKSKYVETNPALVAYSVRARNLGLTYGQLQAKEIGSSVHIGAVPSNYMKVSDKIVLAKTVGGAFHA